MIRAFLLLLLLILLTGGLAFGSSDLDFVEINAGSDSMPEANFGEACSASQDTVINSGGGEIFTHDRSGLSWNRLIPSVDFDASSLAICADGSRLVASSSIDGVRVYDRAGQGWSENTALSAEVPLAVAISGDCETVLVGLLVADTTKIFRPSGVDWVEIDEVPGGSAVAVSHDGSRWFSANSQANVAYITDEGVETPEEISPPEGSHLFGFALDASPDGDQVTICDPEWENLSGHWVGACFVYRESNDWVLQETETLVASDGMTDDHFGHSAGVTSNGETFIGSPFNGIECPGSGCNTGAVYRFEDGNEIEKLISFDPEKNNHLGWCVSAGGGTVLLSEPRGGTSNEGRSLVSTHQTIFSDGFESGDTTGWSTSTP
jgi:hypothetical protein